jgi:hypothetical protein
MLLSLDYEYEDGWQYECLSCGRTDTEDIEDDTEENRSNGGMVFPSMISETFICSYCRFFIEE